MTDRQEIYHDFFTNINDYVKSIYEYKKDHPFLQDCFKNNKFNEIHGMWAHYLEYNKREAVSTGNNRKVHSMLVFIMLGTLNSLENGFYRRTDGASIALGKTKIKNIVYKDESEIELDMKRERPFKSTSVILSNEDCMEIAMNLINSGENDVVVLNMASKTSPNGGWIHGHWAQVRTVLNIRNRDLL